MWHFWKLWSVTCPLSKTADALPRKKGQTSKKATTSNDYPGYDTGKTDGEVPVLELWGMWSTPSFPLLPGQPWTGAVVPVRVSSMVN